MHPSVTAGAYRLLNHTISCHQSKHSSSFSCSFSFISNRKVQPCLVRYQPERRLTSYCAAAASQQVMPPFEMEVRFCCSHSFFLYEFPHSNHHRPIISHLFSPAPHPHCHYADHSQQFRRKASRRRCCTRRVLLLLL